MKLNYLVKEVCTELLLKERHIGEKKYKIKNKKTIYSKRRDQAFLASTDLLCIDADFRNALADTRLKASCHVKRNY